MALLDNAKKEAQDTAAPQKEAQPKKKSNSEYQKRQREKALASAQTIAKVLTKEQLAQPGVQEAIDFLTRVKKPGANNGNFGTPVFEKLFGAEPKVPTTVSAYDMLKKTGKGFGDMNKLLTKWAEKGTIVKFDEDKLEYTLTKLGA